jgi:hypothetical protein
MKIPTDYAKKGACGAAKRALAKMRPGLAKDYEARRVGESCSLKTNRRRRKRQ